MLRLIGKTLFAIIVIIGFFISTSAQSFITSYPSIMEDHFEDSAYSQSIWTPVQNFKFENGETGRGISMYSTGSGIIITTPLSIDTIKGGSVVLQANVKAENISQPPNSWNGIKVMLKIELDDGSILWPQAKLGTGTFDWVNGSVMADIPSNAVKTTIVLGLEKCSGKVWFDDVLVRLVKNPSQFPPSRDSNIIINKFHSEPALRGAMVNTNASEEDLQVLGGQWNANLIRWQLGRTSYPDGLQTAGYDGILDNELLKLDSALPWCKEYGLRVIADLHSLSKGWEYSAKAQEKLVEVWKKIAMRYKGNNTVWAYDLVNEPNITQGNWGDDSMMIWEDLAEKIARTIRTIDPEKPIIVESPSADPAAFKNLRPLDFSIPGIIYSAHMYKPHKFTHQTLYNYTGSYDYPDTIDGIYYDKNKLKEILSPVLEFQNKYRVPILIGEFSAIRWAPDNSAYNYIKDCIEIFEEYNWDWCYHAFREWNGWSVELGNNQNDTEPAPEPTQRELLLRSYYSKNIKTTSADKSSLKPSPGFTLNQNYPNPFNPSTVISYTIPAAGPVSIKLYDVLGREVAVLMHKEQLPGYHEVVLDARNINSSIKISSGIYFYIINSGKYTAVRKMILLK